jgi:hypothetical protein
MFESLETRSMFSATVAIDPGTSSQSDAPATIVAAATTSAPTKPVTILVRKAGGDHVE